MTLQIKNSKLVRAEIAERKNIFLKEQLSGFFKRLDIALNKFARELDCPRETTNEEFSFYEEFKFPNQAAEPEEIRDYVSKYLEESYKELKNNNWKVMFDVFHDDYFNSNNFSITINVSPYV